ncbi:hypothetical protein ACHAW6_000801 [Cyclotella cf. meneghiniana]
MDEFWSIVFLPNNSNNIRLEHQHQEQDDHEFDECPSAITSRYFTILPPHETAFEPLTLQIQMNCNEGVFSDISAIPWDASYLLAGYLYGTHEGRRLCFDACHSSHGDDGTNPYDAEIPRQGGILELGSGLGIVGMAAVAASMAIGDATNSDCVHAQNCTGKYRDSHHSTYGNVSKREKSCPFTNRVVMTDINDNGILSHLKRNVDANLAVILGRDHHSNISQKSQERMTSICVSVEPCDWIEVSSHLQSKIPSKHDQQQHVSEAFMSTKTNFPTGPFTLVLGSALIYLPQHAAACADTLYYYLSYDDDGGDSTTSHESLLVETKQQRQAILVQLPDRCGFTTHFLPRCCELGLEVTCREFEEEFIARVETGLGESIPSVREYRMYFIRMKNESVV